MKKTRFMLACATFPFMFFINDTAMAQETCCGRVVTTKMMTVGVYERMGDLLSSGTNSSGCTLTSGPPAGVIP